MDILYTGIGFVKRLCRKKITSDGCDEIILLLGPRMSINYGAGQISDISQRSPSMSTAARSLKVGKTDKERQMTLLKKRTAFLYFGKLENRGGIQIQID